MEEEVTRIKHRRPLLTVLVGVGALAALALFFLWWAYPPYQATRSFEEPKITTVHLDEEPFGRLALQPGDSYRPIEVMAGTRVPFLCGVVSIAPGSRFTLSAFGRTHDAADCVFDLDVPANVGEHHDLVLTYWDAPDQGEPTDTLTIPAVVVARNERVEFHAVEDAAGNTIRGAAVPAEVRVYARAVTQLPSDGRDYGALFFTSDPANGVPVLELAPVKQGETPLPMVGQVLRYRSYGKDLSGYALWSPDPIRMGGQAGDRQVTDVHVGIFPRDQIDRIFKQVLKVEISGPDTLRVTPLVTGIAEVAAMTVHGRLMSPALHLVKAPAPADSSVRTVPIPAIQQ